MQLFSSTDAYANMKTASLCVQVYVQLLELGPGAELTSIFQSLCSGHVKIGNLPYHVTAQASLEWDSMGKPLTATKTVHLLVRNECAKDINITIDHQVDLLLAVPLNSAVACAQVRGQQQ